jgi:hypothetical protein
MQDLLKHSGQGPDLLHGYHRLLVHGELQDLE